MQNPPTVAERLEFVRRLLRNRHVHMSLAVIRLGEIHFTTRCETAAIVTTDTRVRLFFNPEFFREIDNLELAGVLTHEALHFLLHHQSRRAAITNQRDAFLFSLACDAVINDLIRRCYADLKLPLHPVTGHDLVGMDVSDQSAEEVLQMLRASHARQENQSLARFGRFTTLDDHDVWISESPLIADVKPEWTARSSAMSDKACEGFVHPDRQWGNTPLGRERQLDGGRRGRRRSLSRFLNQTMAACHRYETNWSAPNRRLVSVYPAAVLPNYDLIPRWRILMAIDTSGSVPDLFAAEALRCSKKPLQNAEIELISFDTEV